MDFVKQLTRNFFHYFSNETSTSSKRKRIEARASLEEVIRGSNFYLLAFFKPQSVIELLTVNKGLHTLLSDEVINQYGKQCANSSHWKNAFGSMIPVFTNYNLSYREFFVRQLRISPRYPRNYYIRGNFNFYVKKDDKLFHHTLIVDGSNHTKILLPDHWLLPSDTDLSFLVQDVCIILEPIFQPTWLRDTGPFHFWYGEAYDPSMEQWDARNRFSQWIPNSKHNDQGVARDFFNCDFKESNGRIELYVDIETEGQNPHKQVYLLPYVYELEDQEDVEYIERFFKVK